ncbi:hypothetical protein pdam_00011194 [Pocillopora damicornis]|uniref:Uncharacterized protein n=1 Tax=Pocillopora damicornis TaxID=46731 RepID=A0A3M6TSG6_POCDA|nr:hypothetical protein pdam_00011194 [Pocillopora damicornis]
MSPHCIYESENNLAQRLPADMEEKVIKYHRIPQDLIEKSFKSCGIANALDGSEDDAVWEEENEETEDAEEIIDNEFETDSEGEEGE